MLSTRSPTPHAQVTNNTPWWCLSYISMDKMLLFVDFLPTASPMLCLKTHGKHGACRVNLKGWWEVDWDMKGGDMFKLIWSKGSTVLFKDQQQPQKIELQWCLLAANRKIQVTCHAHYTALCGISWHLGGMSLPHPFFSLKNHVLERNSVILEGVKGDEQGYENFLGDSKFLSYHRCILIS